MNHPWEKIELGDYESHMKLNSVMQLQTMNEIMLDQFYRYDISTAMILGIAGGNGLNHVKQNKFGKIYGVDINGHYLKECVARFPELQIFIPIEADLQGDITVLPQSDIIIANLLIEYIGYKHFQRVILHVRPRFVSCVIQVNMNDNFVSNSPYMQVFDCLDEIHQNITEYDLERAMSEIGYKTILRNESALPNMKKLVRIDYMQ